MGSEAHNSVIKKRGGLSFQPFGEYLKELREKASLTQREAGKAIGVSNAYICQIENGQREPPSPRQLIKFAEVYDRVPLVDLLGRAGYLLPLASRAQRLWRRDRAAIMADPSVRAWLDQSLRQSMMEDAFMSLATRLDYSPFRSSMEQARAAAAELERMFDTGLRAALSDPDVFHSRYFRSKSPKLANHVRGIIEELYSKYRNERQFREGLEMQFTGKVTDLYHFDSPEGGSALPEGKPKESRRRGTQARRK